MSRRVSKRRRKSIRSAAIYLLLIIGLSSLAYGYRYLNSYLQKSLSTFKLVDIEIKGNHILNRIDVLELCGLQQGEAELLRLRPSEVVENLRRSPFIKTASAVRSLPSTLRIVIQERQPVAFIYGKGLNLIDADGFLMPVPRSNACWNLPVICGIKGTLGTLGERVNSKRAQLGARIIGFTRRMASPLNEMIAAIDMSRPDDLRLRLVRGGSEVRLNSKKYRQNLIVLTQYFNTYLDWAKLATIDYFDVRFNNQLIIKEKQG